MCEHTLTNICDSRKICRKIYKGEQDQNLASTLLYLQEYLPISCFCPVCCTSSVCLRRYIQGRGPHSSHVLLFYILCLCSIQDFYFKKNIGSCNFISTKFRTQPETGSDNNISDQQVRVCMDFMICLEISKKVCLNHSGGLDLGRSSQNTQLALR